jgi:hypothetical protein
MHISKAVTLSLIYITFDLPVYLLYLGRDVHLMTLESCVLCLFLAKLLEHILCIFGLA